MATARTPSRQSWLAQAPLALRNFMAHPCFNYSLTGWTARLLRPAPARTPTATTAEASTGDGLGFQTVVADQRILKSAIALFAARCVAVIISRGRLLSRCYRPKPRL